MPASRVWEWDAVDLINWVVGFIAHGSRRNKRDDNLNAAKAPLYDKLRERCSTLERENYALQCENWDMKYAQEPPAYE